MNDQSTVRIVIAVLGSLALAVVIGGIVLALNDKALPGELIAIGSAAAGAVGGILSKTGNPESVMPVTVVNNAADPVPVEDAGRSDLETALLVGLAAFGLVCLLFILT